MVSWWIRDNHNIAQLKSVFLQADLLEQVEAT
jgi:hypothetical protein